MTTCRIHKAGQYREEEKTFSSWFGTLQTSLKLYTVLLLHMPYISFSVVMVVTMLLHYRFVQLRPRLVIVFIIQ